MHWHLFKSIAKLLDNCYADSWFTVFIRRVESQVKIESSRIPITDHVGTFETDIMYLLILSTIERNCHIGSI